MTNGAVVNGQQVLGAPEAPAPAPPRPQRVPRRQAASNIASAPRAFGGRGAAEPKAWRMEDILDKLPA